jgi:hypothetical protein
LIGDVQKTLLTATEEKKDAQADAKLARQEATSTKEMFEMQTRLQNEMKVELDRSMPLAAAAQPKDVKTQMNEIKDFVEAMRGFNKSGLMGPEAIREDDNKKWEALLTGIQLFASKIPHKAWLNFANAAVNLSKTLNDRLAAGTSGVGNQVRPQTHRWHSNKRRKDRWWRPSP